MQKQLESLRRQARESSEKSDYNSALVYYTTILTMLTSPEEVAEIHNIIGSIYMRMSNPAKANTHYSESASFWKISNNQHQYAVALANIALSFAEQAYISEALQYYEQAIGIFRELGDIRRLSQTLNLLGNIQAEQAQYQLALQTFTEAEYFAKECNNTALTTQIIGNIGTVYDELGDYAHAAKYYYRALEQSENHNLQEEQAINLSNLADIYTTLGNAERALAYYKKAIIIHEQLGNTSRLAMDIASMGTVYADMLADTDSALMYLHRALELYQSIHRQKGTASLLANLADIYLRKKDIKKAEQYAQEAFSISKNTHDKRAEAFTTMLLAYIIEERDAEKLLTVGIAEMYKQAIVLAEEYSFKDILHKVYYRLACLYEKLEQWQDFAHCFKKYHQVEQELASRAVRNSAESFAIERDMALVQQEQQIIDRLLKKTFPASIVPILKSGSSEIMEEFESASVLFADIVGFTPLSAQCSAKTMVSLLNSLFSRFDTVMREFGCERIRTIGDGYLAVCGLPTRTTNHTYKLLSAAFALLEQCSLPEHLQTLLPANSNIQIRIGLHSGPLFGGIVGGLEKWQYDIYGDTANTASRMESNGVAGKIHCSESVKNILANSDEFIFIPREPLFIKGKGIMQTYFAEKKRS